MFLFGLSSISSLFRALRSPSCLVSPVLRYLSSHTVRTSLWEAAVPHWSTTLLLSLHPLLHPPLHPLPLDWTQTEESAGCGQHRGRGRGLSSHRRNGVGTWRVKGSQCAAGKVACLLLTKQMVVSEKIEKNMGNVLRDGKSKLEVIS